MRYLKALGLDDFKAKILSGHNAMMEGERVRVAKARGRVLASAIRSPINVPHFRRAMRDGYAVRARDTFGASEENPLIFDLVEEVPAGKIPLKKVGEHQCTYVATGSMIPENADGVVMIEFTEAEDSKIKIKQAITPETFVIPVGKDIREGEEIFPAGTVLTSLKLGVLAAIGLEDVWVYRKTRVGVMSTGNEIIPLGSPLQEGKIFDINSMTLSSRLEDIGVVVTLYGIIPDDEWQLVKILKETLQTQDIIILSGGTSKGREDLMPRILEIAPDVDLILHGARIKPGKPILYARWHQKPVFVLPGYPASCLMTYLLFVEPLILQMNHYPPKEDKIIEARLSTRVYSELGKLEFKTVKVEYDKEIDALRAYPIEKGSESITTLANADGYFIIKEMQTIVEEGQVVKVHLFQ